MKYSGLFLVFLCTFSFCQAQYYYNDIITTQQNNKQYMTLTINNTKQVSAKSFEANNEPTSDFLLEQKITNNNTQITTTTSYPSTGKTISVSQYNNNKIVKTIDSADNVKTTTTYTYNNKNIISTNTITEDAFMANSSQETHQWQYENNVPVKMLLIKNSTDTTIIEFIKDEQGNIAEEHWKKKGSTLEKFYYYYNNKRQLTDVVRFNIKARRLLPDFLFEYNNDGTIAQFTQVPQGSDNYLVWKYLYLPNGLKDKEICFNKKKEKVGTIEYSYK
jgi:hypothetical protein